MARRRYAAWIAGTLALVAAFAAGLEFGRRYAPRPKPAEAPSPPLAQAPLRVPPAKFPRNTSLPPVREIEASGGLLGDRFSAGRDLVYVNDLRAWWESDGDENDDEDDHTLHAALAPPLNRLIGLVSDRGGVLEIHDTYRPNGVHHAVSLHKEGRAVDVTCDDMDIADLAKLCWAAGFDWVLHEAKPPAGPHVHCSVRP